MSSVCEGMNSSRSWAEAGSAQEKCEAMKDAMRNVGRSVLGQAWRKEADLFRKCAC